MQCLNNPHVEQLRVRKDTGLINATCKSNLGPHVFGLDQCLLQDMMSAS
jgi:hypothetical protein